MRVLFYLRTIDDQLKFVVMHNDTWKCAWRDKQNGRISRSLRCGCMKRAPITPIIEMWLRM